MGAEVSLQLRSSSIGPWEQWPPTLLRHEDEAVAADRCMEELLLSEGKSAKAAKAARHPPKSATNDVEKSATDPSGEASIEASATATANVQEPMRKDMDASPKILSKPKGRLKHSKEDEVAAADRAMEELLRAEEAEVKKRKDREQQR